MAGVPLAIRWAGAVVAGQGVIALVVALVLVGRGFGGGQQRVAFGTSGWFALAGAVVAAAGWALYRGRRWGRGLAVFVQLLLLPVAWYMAVGSQRPELGVPVAAAALATLALLFSPPAVRWAAGSGAGPHP